MAGWAPQAQGCVLAAVDGTVLCCDSECWGCMHTVVRCDDTNDEAVWSQSSPASSRRAASQLSNLRQKLRITCPPFLTSSSATIGLMVCGFQQATSSGLFRFSRI
ncbi:hypothetical protein C8F04DRAFT_1145772 [Mycena alexandri]|uniref:Uncharacterized protein n=1 Tax=Mycena alexandri TaxID=1745969 RepID=A0AAD6WMM6_9AGAR|nr:hypothetical protein C8F04DRAFT_1145772 [Mycena alexandri]